MKVPKYIIVKMEKSNELISEGNSLIADISRYFLDKGATLETVEKIADELSVPHNGDCINKLIELMKGEE